MKKRVLFLLCMAFAMMAWLPPQLWAQTQPSGGDGSSESPFLITTAEELKWYANYVNGESGDNVVHTTACAKLMNDIDLSTVCGKGKGNGRYPQIKDCGDICRVFAPCVFCRSNGL